MFAPPLYKVRKFPLKLLIDSDFYLEDSDELDQYLINQQDNMLFRQIRLITGNSDKRNDYIIFVNCKGGKAYQDAIAHAICNGFYIGETHYVVCERSASMVRTSILSFIDENIYEELTRRVTMDLDVGKTVLSKWYAYRGLMLSSCHCLEGWIPRIIIVPDLYQVIPNQTIRYVYDKHLEYEKDGQTLPWVQKDITVGQRDITINAADGCGIHHPNITDTIRGMLDAKSDPTTILLRMPFMKGVSHEFDYETFFLERGVTEIVDVWGVKHDVSPGSEPAMLLTESMYKGYKYFKNTGTYADWEHYWDMFKKYNHCIGIAKWNFSLEEEPMYTRANYQILQDLDLPYEEFALLAKDSIGWAEKILSGDPLYLYAFLGLYADDRSGLNLKMEALAKNRHMIHEEGIRQYVMSLVTKTIDEMKCGKLYLKSCFKFVAPDLIMLAEHIGGLPPVGCLESDEFYTFNRDGIFSGEYLIERNPHICSSEHVILNAVNNALTKQYCSHLVNVCMINSKSITPQRLNGCDFDGDLVLVIDNDIMKRGVHRNAPIVMDVEDKITAAAEEDTLANRVAVTLRDKSNLIGEYSNYATAYHNKTPRTQAAKDQYTSFVCLLSVATGKVIDFSKTGVMYNIPRNIAKYGRPLPYFMKYASPYYASMKTLSHAHSNMNLLCREIERWHNDHKWKRTKSDFNYTIMIDSKIPFDKNKFDKIEELFLEYIREQSRTIRQYQADLSKAANKKKTDEFEYVNQINWTAFYNRYRQRCLDICLDICELANYAVILCYEKYPKRPKTFLWTIAGEGIVSNLQQTEQYLPMRDPNGEYVYLGKRYRMEKI